MRLNQVTRYCTNLEQSVAFYRALGLQLIVFSANHYARLVCPDGDATFSLHQTDAPVSADTQTLIYFECDELDAKVAQLQQAGLVFETLPLDQRWLWREAYLRDPDGHQVCLYFAGNNRLNPPWRINDTAIG